MAGLKGGAGAQGICYNEDGLAGRVSGQPLLLRLGCSDRLSIRDPKGGRNLTPSRGDRRWSRREMSPTSARSRWPSRPMARASGSWIGRSTAGSADGPQNRPALPVEPIRLAARGRPAARPTGDDPAAADQVARSPGAVGPNGIPANPDPSGPRRSFRSSSSG